MIPARFHDPKYLWSLIVPAFLFLVIVALVLFIIIRKVAKHKNYDKLLEDTYGTSGAPAKEAKGFDDEGSEQQV